MKTALSILTPALFFFVFLQAIPIQGQVIPCPAPTGLAVTAITDHAATLSWDPTGAVKYQLSYCPMGNPVWKSLTVTTAGKTIGNLMPNTTYSWLVRSVCPGSATNTMTTGPWSEIGYFTTLPTAPSCHASFVFTLIPNPAPNTGFAVQFNSTSTGVNNTTLYLWDFGDNTTSNLQNPLHSYMQPGAYQVCLTITTLFANATVTCTDTWCHQVSIPVITPCPAPDSLQSSMIMEHAAQLDWSNTGALMYLLRYRKLSSSNTGSPWVNVTVQTNTLVLTNLLPSSNYEWQVRGKCANASGTMGVSPWSASAFFMTSAGPVNAMPSGPKAVYEYPGNVTASARVDVFSLTGTLVYSTTVSLEPGRNELDLDRAGLGNGIYLLRVRTADLVETIKFSHLQ